MRTINKITVTLLSLSVMASLSGCGSGGSDASFENTSSGTAVASCGGAISTWTTVNSGDVVSAQPDAQLSFDHDSNDNKKVCVKTGTATIL